MSFARVRWKVCLWLCCCLILALGAACDVNANRPKLGTITVFRPEYGDVLVEGRVVRWSVPSTNPPSPSTFEFESLATQTTTISYVPDATAPKRFVGFKLKDFNTSSYSSSSIDDEPEPYIRSNPLTIQIKADELSIYVVLEAIP